MRKLLNNRWFVSLLGVAALAFVWLSVANKSAVHYTGAPQPAEEPLPAAEPETGEPRLSEHDALKQLARVSVPRDPFASRPLAETSSSASTDRKPEQPDIVETVLLSAVWTQNGATLALVNGQIRAVGDMIGRIKIESASPEGVWLSHWQGRNFIAPGESFTLKTPARLAGNPSSP